MLRKGPVGLHKLHAHKAGPVMKVTRITAIYMKCVPFVVTLQHNNSCAFHNYVSKNM